MYTIGYAVYDSGGICMGTQITDRHHGHINTRMDIKRTMSVESVRSRSHRLFEQQANNAKTWLKSKGAHTHTHTHECIHTYGFVIREAFWQCNLIFEHQPATNGARCISIYFYMFIFLYGGCNVLSWCVSITNTSHTSLAIPNVYPMQWAWCAPISIYVVYRMNANIFRQFI